MAETGTHHAGTKWSKKKHKRPHQKRVAVKKGNKNVK